MTSIGRNLLALVILCLFVAPSAAAEPARVAVGFYVFDVRDVNLKEQSFYADFYLWIRYPPAAAEVAREIERIDFMNGRIDSREECDRRTVQGDVYVCWRVEGTFYFRGDLRNYPFDTQDLAIVLEHPSLDMDALVYVDDVQSYERSGLPPDRWAVREDLEIPEFTFSRAERAVHAQVYRTDFGDLDRREGESRYSRIALRLRFQRSYMPYLFKIVIPLIVIVAMAYLVFWIPPKEIQTASGLAITALLSCIAFNVTVGQNLPEVGYLVVSDKFFLTTYFLLFGTLLQSVVTYAWADAGLEARAMRWERRCRLVFPILYFAAFAYLMSAAMVER